MKKRLLTVLLAVILVAALGTVTAWAEERMVVAKIGDGNSSRRKWRNYCFARQLFTDKLRFSCWERVR